jgi:hypothetical protein
MEQEEMSVARYQLGKHAPVPTNTYATIKEPSEVVFST